MFIKAGDSKIKEGLRVEKVTGDSLGGTLLWLPRNVIGESQGFQLAGKSEKKGALETGTSRNSGSSCYLPLLLWLQVSWGPLEFRRK